MRLRSPYSSPPPATPAFRIAPHCMVETSPLKRIRFREPSRETPVMRRCSHVLLAILLGTLSSGCAIAQTQASAKISKKELNAIAGCLTRSGSEYRLLGSDGSFWEIQVEKTDRPDEPHR